MGTFYLINNDYRNFLYNSELKERGFSRVPFFDYGQDRKPKFTYGVVLKINNVDYYVPVSSYKIAQKDNLLIRDKHNTIVGSLRFNYMVPVPQDCVQELIINEIKDEKYKELVFQEHEYCRKNNNKILHTAISTYLDVISKEYPGLTRNSCDFALLEKKCKEYIERSKQMSFIEEMNLYKEQLESELINTPESLKDELFKEVGKRLDVVNQIIEAYNKEPFAIKDYLSNQMDASGKESYLIQEELVKPGNSPEIINYYSERLNNVSIKQVVFDRAIQIAREHIPEYTFEERMFGIKGSELFKEIKEEKIMSESQQNLIGEHPYVGRIDYLSPDGKVSESMDFTDPDKFLSQIKENSHDGVPFKVVLYEDDRGNINISKELINQLDPPPKGMLTEKAPEKEYFFDSVQKYRDEITGSRTGLDDPEENKKLNNQIKVQTEYIDSLVSNIKNLPEVNISTVSQYLKGEITKLEDENKSIREILELIPSNSQDKVVEQNKQALEDNFLKRDVTNYINRIVEFNTFKEPQREQILFTEETFKADIENQISELKSKDKTFDFVFSKISNPVNFVTERTFSELNNQALKLGMYLNGWDEPKFISLYQLEEKKYTLAENAKGIYIQNLIPYRKDNGKQISFSTYNIIASQYHKAYPDEAEAKKHIEENFGFRANYYKVYNVADVMELRKDRTDKLSAVPDMSVKSWLLGNTTDPLANNVLESIKFKDVYELLEKGQGAKIYSLIGVSDSILREKVFNGLSEAYGKPYKDIYDMFLNEQVLNKGINKPLKESADKLSAAIDELNKNKNPRIKVSDFRKEIANKFIEGLKEQKLTGKDWKQGWANTATPRNGDGKTYRGINTVNLTYYMIKNNVKDPRFYTFNQITEHNKDGWKLQKGSHGLKVEYLFPYDFVDKKAYTWDEYNKLIENNPSKETDFNVYCKYYTVFNAEQIEGIPPFVNTVNKDLNPDKYLNEVAKSMGVVIKNDGRDNAYYRPADDTIHLPAYSSFKSQAELNSTLAHELGHSTGSPVRLDRNIGNSFGSKEYAYEELVAEISSAFMSQELQTPLTENSLNNNVAYVNSWISSLENDPSQLFKAIEDAKKAADYQIDSRKKMLEFLKEPKKQTIAETLEKAKEKQKEYQKNAETLSQKEVKVQGKTI